MKTLKKYHQIWMEKNNKTEDWLREMLKEGFHIHHADGDKVNESPKNLVLIYGKDHLELHGVGLKQKLSGLARGKLRRLWITPDKKYFVIKRHSKENAMKFHHEYRRNDDDFIKTRCLPVEQLTEYERAKYL